jgi:hypothetical protein
VRRAALALAVTFAWALTAPARAEGEPAKVRIATGDGKGTIFVDGKAVGEGSFSGPLPAGTHTIRVERAGFVPFEKQITLREGDVYGESVSLARQPAKESHTPIVEETSAGLYGGFQIGPAFQEGTTGGAFGGDCSLFGATSCASGQPVGLSLGGYFGYSWDPIGLELFGTGGADLHEPTASFDGIVRPGSNPVLTGPPRRESWHVLRAGGGGAVRARVIWDPHPRFRFTFAIGPGLAVRHVIAVRRAVAQDGSGAEDQFAPPGAAYASPALSVDLAAHLRLAPGVSLALGMGAWLETAWDALIVQGDSRRVLVLPSGPVPLRTPSYRLLQGTQAFIGPYLGMQFGP